VSRKSIIGLAVGTLLLAAVNLSADTVYYADPVNLLLNPGFATPASSVTPGTPDTLVSLDNSGGSSAAADWKVWSNGSANIITELVPSTFPGGGSYMLKVTTTGSNGGIYQDFLSTPAASATASAWIWIVSGCVGIGSGDDGDTGEDTQSCTTGSWLHLSAPSDSSPVTAFLAYDTSLGATFYVDDASVVPGAAAATPEPSALVLLGSGLLGLGGFVRRRAWR
jgi:hypothetical protein